MQRFKYKKIKGPFVNSHCPRDYNKLSDFTAEWEKNSWNRRLPSREASRKQARHPRQRSETVSKIESEREVTVRTQVFQTGGAKGTLSVLHSLSVTERVSSSQGQVDRKHSLTLACAESYSKAVSVSVAWRLKEKFSVWSKWNRGGCP